MSAPMASEDVAAGEGALRTWSTLPDAIHDEVVRHATRCGAVAQLPVEGEGGAFISSNALWRLSYVGQHPVEGEE